MNKHHCTFSVPVFTVSLLLSFLISSAALMAQRPYITSSFPNDQAENLPCNTFIKANVFFTSEGNILDPITLHSESVKLYPKGNPKQIITSDLRYDEENRFITLIPKEVLLSDAYYVFEVTPDLVDERGFGFLPFTLSFSTGQCAQKPEIVSRGEEELIEPEKEELKLPKLLQFSSDWQGDSILISWQTDRYWPIGELVLEYAQEQTEFEEQARFDVMGDIWKRQSYEWLDPEPAWGWNYYRLSFYGIDDQTFSTDTLKIFRPLATFSSTEIPRDGNVSVDFLLERTSTMAFVLKTRSGEIVRRKAGMLPAGAQQLNISMKGVQPGYYIAHLRTKELTLAEVIRILAE